MIEFTVGDMDLQVKWFVTVLLYMKSSTIKIQYCFFYFLRQHFLMYFWLIIIILYEKMKTGEDENNVQKAGGI